MFILIYLQFHSNVIDTYSAPPADAFAPGYQRRPSSSIRPSGSYGAPPPQSPSFTYGPPQPSQPSGSYGAPPLVSFKPVPSNTYGAPSGLGISHGSVTGNLKQWPINFNPPKQPIAFRAPVPPGLIESIGHSVQHQDTFGIKLPQQSPVYLPPPTGEIPPPPHGLESLPLEQSVPFHSSSSNQVNIPQTLPLQQARYPSECSHGPSLGGFQAQSIQSIYGVPNAPLDVAESGFEVAQNNIQSNLLDSYGPPASGTAPGLATGSIESIGSIGNINVPEIHEPSSSYGPPPSGNPADSIAYSSQHKSTSVSIDSTASTSNVAAVEDKETKVGDLPGLAGAGLDIVSAKQSKSIEIPIQGKLGSYSIQFQSANPISSQNNEVGGGPDHQKLLSEGLLQSILSAIEQPQSNSQSTAQSSSSGSIQNHQEVDRFLKSSIGQQTLAEPKKVN